MQMVLDRQQLAPPRRAHAFRRLERAGIDASKVEIELNSRLISPDEAETLLASDDDDLVSRFQVPGGQRAQAR